MVRRVVHTFHDLVVWKQAMGLCVAVYGMTAGFAAHERFGLVQEMRKTARSVACNIAEGHRRASTAEYVRFLDIARGSAAELETQLLLCEALHYTDESTTHGLLCDVSAVDRMLAALIARLRAKLA